jgi:single-strand DNA-binding protein
VVVSASEELVVVSDVQITVIGWVGTDVEFSGGNGTGTARASFRVASTPRFYDRSSGEWRDQETVWVTVKAWRALATHVSSSVRRGEPVIVVGKLRAESWRDEAGEARRRDVVEAITVGHDLTRGTAAYLRRPVAPSGDATVAPQPEQPEGDASVVRASL